MSGPRPFRFAGRLPASKSILNRLLVIASHAAPGTFRVRGDSDADDVRLLRGGLAALAAGRPADCGAAGTVLRFLALRASRLPGRHRLTGTPRLLARPLAPLLALLRDLGARAEIAAGDPPALVIGSNGIWELSQPIVVDRSQSSQFASAALLSAWSLPAPLTLRLTGAPVSEAYLAMTLALVRNAGLRVDVSGEVLTVAPSAAVQPGEPCAEIDLGAAFAVAAAAAVAGEAELEPFPAPSLQPDRVFVDILAAMGVPLEHMPAKLVVRRAGALRPVDWNLRDSPDLFPVLAVLAALADGTSRLLGAPHLGLKESDRLARSAALVAALGRTFEPRHDGLVIHGQGWQRHERTIPFDPDQDHRLAMAAGVALKAGFDVRVTDPAVVSKSFPDFWAAIGEAP
ncbi:MAG: 3-phosphoshikimate 1-carboxyvinyltransferase [Planctomycetes bacterium]|nr:3-phosphoshikimate 1-carboxyvinyltransferase [Planctomycetota bacterium]